MIQPIMSTETSRMVYFAYVHSILSFGIILGGNQPHSKKIFKLQKQIIRIITHSKMRDSCRELFKRLKILLLYSQYIFSLSMFVVKNKHLLLLYSQYIFSLSMFVVKNKHLLLLYSQYIFSLSMFLVKNKHLLLLYSQYIFSL